MNDLIGRQAAIDLFPNDALEWDTNGGYIAPHFARRMIEELPSAQPVRHGKWLDLEAFKRPWFRHHIFECSVCGNTLDMDGINAGRGDANYCPNCGAKMDAEREEE